MDPSVFDHIEEIEIGLLLEAVFQRFGYDFREYSRPSLRRRLALTRDALHLDSLSALQERILRDPDVMARLLQDLSINVSAMFRDPGFYRIFREKVVPILKTYPSIKIWHAGCAKGEEVLSMAILLIEEDLYARTQIYATDINAAVLETAKARTYPTETIKKYTTNYVAYGGRSEFSKYYSARHDYAIFESYLTDHVVFAEHNLAVDRSFNEFQAVICRNVLIYFNRDLQARVLQLLDESLCPFGILGLGDKESLTASPLQPGYQPFDARHRLFRRTR